MQRWSKVRLAENATTAKLGGVDAHLNVHVIRKEAADVGSVVEFLLTLYQTGGDERQQE